MNMIFRNLDTNGDWCFGRGKNDFLTTVSAIKMNIRTRILSWFGDCFFAQNEGIDWYNRMGKTNQRTLLEDDIKRVIVQSYGVAELVSFESSLEDRVLTAEYVVKTIYGEEIIETISTDVVGDYSSVLELDSGDLFELDDDSLLELS